MGNKAIGPKKANPGKIFGPQQLKKKVQSRGKIAGPSMEKKRKKGNQKKSEII